MFAVSAPASFPRFALVRLRQRLHNLKPGIADQLEPVGIIQFAGHHIEDQPFFDRRRGLRKTNPENPATANEDLRKSRRVVRMESLSAAGRD